MSIWFQRQLIYALAALIVSVVVGYSLCGCASYRAWQRRESAQHLKRCIEFVQHPKTRQCFAVNNCGGGIAVVENKYCR